MKTFTLIFISLLILLAAPALVRESIVHADEQECIDWFGNEMNGDPDDWEAVNPTGDTYPGGEVLEDKINGTYAGNNEYAIRHVGIVFPEPRVVTSITISVEYNQTRSFSSAVRARALTYGGESDPGPYNLITEDTPGNYTGGPGTYVHQWEGSITVPGLLLFGQAPSNGADGAYIRFIHVQICDNGAAVYYQPLVQSDEASFLGFQHYNHVTGLFANESHPGTSYAVSTAPGKLVHAAVGGEIVSVKPLDLQLCGWIFTLGTYNFADPCNFVLTNTGTETAYVFEPRPDKAGVFVVRLYNEDLDRTFYYVVKNAYSYVQQFDVIQANCILGETWEFFEDHTVTDSSLSFGVSFGPLPSASVSASVSQHSEQSLQSEGIVFVMVKEGSGWGGDFSEVYEHDLYTLEPTTTTACGQSKEYRDCVGDGQLSNPGSWESVGAVSWLSPGVALSGGAFIQSQYNLEVDGNPKMTVAARSVGGTGSLRIGIGQSSMTFPAAAGDYVDYEIEGSDHGGGDIADGIFSILISNKGTTQLQILYACISYTTDPDSGDPLPDPEPQPPACYFQNASFNSGGAGWSATGSTESVDGALRLYDGDTIAQNVHLHPGTYYFRVTHSLYHYNTYTPSPTDTTGTVSLEFDWPTGTGYSAIDDVTISQYALSNNLLVSEVEIVVADETDGSFVIRASLADNPADVPGVTFRDVCLGTDGGEPFPGYDEPTSPTPPITDGQCDIQTIPPGNDIGQWIYWLWGNFRGFFSCELMPVLNQMLEALQDILRLIAWRFRYYLITLEIYRDYFGGQIVPWLSGHFANMANGRQTFVQINETEQCGNLFCLVESIFGGFTDIFVSIGDVIRDVITEVLGPIVQFIIQLLNVAFGFVFSLIQTLFNLALQFITAIIGIFLRVFDLFSIIVNAWNNATPEPIPGMPTCSVNPEQSGYCVVLWVLENTIFSGRGALIIPILTAYLWVLMALWAIQSLRTRLMEGASVS